MVNEPACIANPPESCQASAAVQAECPRLSTWHVRQPACVSAITCPLQGLRLREIGICEGHVVEVLQTGDPLICRVGGCRMGICRRLAEHVLLAAIAEPTPHTVLQSA